MVMIKLEYGTTIKINTASLLLSTGEFVVHHQISSVATIVFHCYLKSGEKVENSIKYKFWLRLRKVCS